MVLPKKGCITSEYLGGQKSKRKKAKKWKIKEGRRKLRKNTHGWI